MSTVRIVNQPFGLNCSLSYLPWAGLTANMDEESLKAIKPDCLAQGGAPLNTVLLVPGMTLRVTDAWLMPPKNNAIAPSLSDYSWRIPEGVLTRADYFFLSILLAAGVPESTAGGPNPPDFVQQFRSFMNATKTNSPGNSYQAISDMALKALQPQIVIGSDGAPTGDPGTARRVHEWLTKPAIEDFEGANYPQNSNMREYLRFGIPGNTGPDSVMFMRAFESGGGFYLDNVKARSGIGKTNAWYMGSDTYPRRFHFDVQVDISLSRELGSRQVPVYYSFADLEREFHIGIFGFQRQSRFFNCVRDIDLNDIDAADVAADGVVTIYFGNPPNPSPTPAVIGIQWPAASTPALKEKLLVAPGDHYFVNPMFP